MPEVPYREWDHGGDVTDAGETGYPAGGGEAFTSLRTLTAEEEEEALAREEAVRERGWKIGFATRREETTMEHQQAKTKTKARYVIEVSVIAECVDDADAEAVGAAVVQKVTGNRLTTRERANLLRIEEATVANVDSDFLRDAA